jgi:Putative transmembrane protein (PGPGW)
MQHNEALVGILAILSVLFWLGTLIVVPIVIVKLPPDYLSREQSVVPGNSPSFWYYPYLIAKNIFGVLFIIAGAAMLVLPGQGLLTLAIGLGLISFPRKHLVIQRILGQQRILKAINRLRSKAHKPPLSLKR